MEMGTIRTKVSRSHREVRAFLSLAFCGPNPTYDMYVAQLYINTLQWWSDKSADELFQTKKK